MTRHQPPSLSPFFFFLFNYSTSTTTSSSNSTTRVEGCCSFSFPAEGVGVGTVVDFNAEEVELRSRGGEAELGAMRRAGG